MFTNPSHPLLAHDILARTSHTCIYRYHFQTCLTCHKCSFPIQTCGRRLASAGRGTGYTDMYYCHKCISHYHLQTCLTCHKCSFPVFTNPSHPLLAHDILARTTVINVFPITTSKLALCVISVVFLFKLVAAGVLSQQVEVHDILTCTRSKVYFPPPPPNLSYVS